MCYLIVEVKEVARIGTYQYDVAEYSYVNEDCWIDINSKDCNEGYWAISNKHEADNSHWFSTEEAMKQVEEAMKQAKEYAKEKSIQYPEKTIVLIDGLQTCGGGSVEIDYAEVYDINGNVILEYATKWNNPDKTEKFDKLTEEMMDKIKLRQIIVEEEERIEEIKRESNWNKRQTLIEPIKEAYEKAYKSYMYGLRGNHYNRHDEKGFPILAPKLKEADLEWKAFEAGAKEGFKVAFKYLQENKKELDLLNQYFINEEENII